MHYDMSTFTECGEVVHQAHIVHGNKKLAIGWGKSPEIARKAADRDYQNQIAAGNEDAQLHLGLFQQLPLS